MPDPFFFDDSNDYFDYKGGGGGTPAAGPGFGPGGGFGGGGSPFTAGSSGAATPAWARRRFFGPLGGMGGGEQGGGLTAAGAGARQGAQQSMSRWFGPGGRPVLQPQQPQTRWDSGFLEALLGGGIDARGGLGRLLADAGAAGAFDPFGSPYLNNILREREASELGAREHAARTQAELSAGDDPQLAAFLGSQARRDVSSDTYRQGLEARERNASAYQDRVWALLSELLGAEGIQGGAGDRRRFEQGGGGLGGMLGNLAGGVLGGWLSPGGLWGGNGD